MLDLLDYRRQVAESYAMLRQRIASGGYELYQQRLTTRAIAEQLVPVIQEASCASVS